MSEFVNPLRVQRQKPDDDDLNWILLTPFGYKSDLLGEVVVVPMGYVTDYASVPRGPLIYWLCGNTSTEASIIHDYLYDKKAHPRKVADAVLREASLASGVPRWRAWLMWAGVRVFGATHWS